MMTKGGSPSSIIITFNGNIGVIVVASHLFNVGWNNSDQIRNPGLTNKNKKKMNRFSKVNTGDLSKQITDKSLFLLYYILQLLN